MQLTRLSSALAVVGNGWFTVLWARARTPEVPVDRVAAGLDGALIWPLLAITLVGFGLYGFGATLNDILDQRRDRLLGADRPIARGRVGMEAAVWIVVLTCGMAVLGSTRFGSTAVVLVLGLQLAVLGYHAAARFVPGLGLVILGAIHAAHMVLANAGGAYAWPVIVIVVHAVGVSAAAHLIGRRTPRLSRRAGVAAAIGTLVLIAAILTVQREYRPPNWPVFVGPVMLAAIFAAWAGRLVTKIGPGSRAAEKISRYGTLWMPLYGIAWLAGAGHWREAAILAGLAAVASLGVGTLRELYMLVAEPVGYRR